VLFGFLAGDNRSILLVRKKYPLTRKTPRLLISF
jgi:hypothetical protein